SGLAPSTAASTRPGTGSGIGSATGSATASPGTRRPATGPRPTSEATSPHAVGGTVFVSDADNGSTVHVTPGQHIEVKLAPSGGSWHQPTSSNAAVLRRDAAAGGYPQPTTAVADFSAASRGRATVTSMTDSPCLHSTPRCMIPQRLF